MNPKKSWFVFVRIIDWCRIDVNVSYGRGCLDKLTLTMATGHIKHKCSHLYSCILVSCYLLLKFLSCNIVDNKHDTATRRQVHYQSEDKTF